MKRVVIIGGKGMLGSMLVHHLGSFPAFACSATVRSDADLAGLRQPLSGISWRVLDCSTCSDDQIVRVLEGADAVINAVGVIKQRIIGNAPDIAEEAVRVNALFSFQLARVAAKVGAKLIGIATDCVFSGAAGGYSEASAHDCLDVYGKSKSLGEVAAEGVINLRCSIIGPELRQEGLSLLNWFLTRPIGSEVSGFSDHHWNGITTLHFARICAAIIESELELDGVQHVVPKDSVSKEQLLRLFAEAFDRKDIDIRPTVAPVGIDRRLATTRPDVNARLWASAGYAEPPSIAEMVAELARDPIVGRYHRS